MCYSRMAEPGKAETKNKTQTSGLQIFNNPVHPIRMAQSFDQSGKPAMSIQPALYWGERLEETFGWIRDRRGIRDLPGHKRLTTTEIHTPIARSKKPRSPLDSLRF